MLDCAPDINNQAVVESSTLALVVITTVVFGSLTNCVQNCLLGKTDEAKVREQTKASLAGRSELDDADDGTGFDKAEEDTGYRRKQTNSVNVPVLEQKLAQGDTQADSKSPLAKDQFLNQFS